MMVCRNGRFGVGPCVMDGVSEVVQVLVGSGVRGR